MISTYVKPSDYVSYKKLVKILESNFDYSLQSSLVGRSTIQSVKQLHEDIKIQQRLIAESTYEYTSNKYRKNIVILEALSHLINLLETRTYRIDPKSGALVNYSTTEDKVKAALNPKDNRPDLSYFTQEHLNIEEPIKVVGSDDNDVEANVTNAANQQAPEENLKKAEVYVGVNSGDPNYSTPTNTALETELAGMTSSDLLNITDKVKSEVKKELASEITDAVKLQKRKQEEKKLGEDTMQSGKIIKKLLESEIEKAEIVLGVKSITDDLQNMVEKISKMQIEDIAALTERLKSEFGIEAGDKFQAEVSAFLGTALSALQQSKSSIDNKALALSGDVPDSQSMDASGAAPVAANPASKDGAEEDMFTGHEAAAGDEEAPLGRIKKESTNTRENKLLEMAIIVEKAAKKLAKDMKDNKDPKKKKELENKAKKLKESIDMLEKWDTEAKLNPKKKGMFAGKTIADLEAMRDRLKKKENHTSAESTKLREINYAIRAKRNWKGKVKESEIDSSSGKEVLMDEGASRKHFRATAETLKHVPDMEKRKMLAKSHADEFKKMNPRFSHEKFFKACGIDECMGNDNGVTFESKELERAMGNKKSANNVSQKTPKNTAGVLDANGKNLKKK